MMGVWRAAVLAAAMIVWLGGCAHGAGTGGRDDALRVMTYNIRLDLAADGENAWPRRKAMVAALIGREAPAVLGLQEVLIGQKRDLESALPGYRMVGVGRDDGADRGEFAPIAYDERRMELLEWGSFWFSPTPAVPGKGWDAAYPRVATWARLRDRKGGAVLRVLNVHLDHVGQIARRESARMITDWAAQPGTAGMPTIVMGDFNAAAGTPPYDMLADTATSRLVDARQATRTAPYGPAATFNGFRIDSDTGGAIDHVFVSPQIVVSDYAVVTQHWGGRLPSDHWPVIVTLHLR